MTEEEIQAQYTLQTPEWDSLKDAKFPVYMPYLDGLMWRVLRIEADGERYLHYWLHKEKTEMEKMLDPTQDYDLGPTDKAFPLVWKTYFPVYGSPAEDRRENEMYLSEMEWERSEEARKLEAMAEEASAYEDDRDSYLGTIDEQFDMEDP